MLRKIEISPYDSRWPELFATESLKVKNALGDNCASIHHIGSTSIPGLAAKPVIDMLPEVVDILAVDQHNAAMQALGYVPMGENGMPFRRFFQKSDGGFTCNVHVFASGDPEIARHLLFRDYLRTHSTDRDAYSSLKQQLAQQFPHDIDGYINGKQAFIDTLVQKAGFNGYRLVMARSEREWAHYHRIRGQQYFEPIGVIFDLQHRTLPIANHYHFLFISGIDVVGTAHIELVEHNKCIIRTVAIDKIYQRQGYGIELLKLAEKWIQQQNYSIIQLHARTDLLPFYEKAGYKPMFFEDPDYERPGSSVDMGKFII